jgi:hypothetical protein
VDQTDICQAAVPGLAEGKREQTARHTRGLEPLRGWGAEPPARSWVSVARTAYRLLITLLVLGVVVQFYLAGAGVFRAHGPGKAVDSSTFDPHRALGDVLIILSLLVLLAALAVRNGRWMFAFALVVLMVVALLVAQASSWVVPSTR